MIFNYRFLTKYSYFLLVALETKIKDFLSGRIKTSTFLFPNGRTGGQTVNHLICRLMIEFILIIL